MPIDSVFGPIARRSLAIEIGFPSNRLQHALKWFDGELCYNAGQHQATENHHEHDEADGDDSDVALESNGIHQPHPPQGGGRH